MVQASLQAGWQHPDLDICMDGALLVGDILFRLQRAEHALHTRGRT